MNYEGRRSAAAGADERFDTALAALTPVVRVGARRASLPLFEVEQARERLGIRADGFRIAHRLELFGRRQEQLLDDEARDVVDAVAGVRRERRGQAFELPRSNIMSYYDERSSLSPLQVARVQEVLALRVAGGMAAP